MRSFAALLLPLLIIPGWAQETLTPDAAVQQALAAHPLLEAGARQIAAAQGERRQAGLAPNPTFTFQEENMRPIPKGSTYWSFTDTFAYVHQPIEMGGKRRQRVEVASAEVQRAELQLELLRKQIAGNVRSAYWKAAGAQWVHELLLENVASFDGIVQYHEARVREGAMAEADLLRVKLESERLKLDANNAKIEADRALIDLLREMGVSEYPDKMVLEQPPAPGDQVLAADAARALGDRTEMALTRLDVEQARAELNLAQANSRPDVSAIAGYKRTAGYNTFLAGFAVDLPLWNRNQGTIAATTARIDAARAQLAATATMVRAEVAAAARSYDVRRRQIEESLEPMLEQADEAARIAEGAYREGGWDLLRLLDAERLRIETRTLYYQALAQYWQSQAELETAMGVLP